MTNEIGTVGIQFTSRFMNSFGMGSHFVLLSELRLMLGSGLALPQKFLEDFLQHAISLIEVEESEEGEESVMRQRCGVSAMLELLTNALMAEEGGSLSKWIPTFFILDNLLAEVLLCTSLRHQPLTSSTRRGGGAPGSDVDLKPPLSGLSSSSAKKGTIACYSAHDTKLRFALSLFRFVTQLYSFSSVLSSSPETVEVTINMPIPPPDTLDLGMYNDIHRFKMFPPSPFFFNRQPPQKMVIISNCDTIVHPPFRIPLPPRADGYSSGPYIRLSLSFRGNRNNSRNFRSVQR